MYKQYLKIKQNPVDDPVTLSVVSTVDIPAKVPIIEMTGDIVDNIGNLDPDFCLQISNKYFIGPSGGIDDQINHSCDPNCYLHIVGKRAILYSLYYIRAGVQLTFDYSLSSTDNPDEWALYCKCGSFNCRKVISGYQHLDDKTKEHYKQLGIVPIFLTEKAFQGW